MDCGALTGLWNGLYSYPGGLPPVFFVATLISHGPAFSGSAEEVAVTAAGRSFPAGSAIRGTNAGAAVEFTKTYDGRGGWTHGVRYAGRLSPDRTEIEGTWTVPGAWSGRFLMMRGERAGEAEMRRAFERA